jgi:hypothetical protein
MLGGVGIFSANVHAQATASKAETKASQELPKAEALFDKYVDAVGGREAFSKVKSVTAKGTLSIPQAGIEGDLEMSQADGKMLMVMEMAGVGKQTVGFDGEVAWQDSDLQGPKLMEGSMLEDIKFQAKIDGFQNAAEYFDSLETVKESKFEGQAVYEVVAKKKDMPDRTIYFSKETGLIVGGQGESESEFGTMNMVTVTSDYKKVGDIMMSHGAEQRMPNGISIKIKMTEIKLNAEMPADKFALPESIKKLIK